jgi:hypothetical protein
MAQKMQKMQNMHGLKYEKYAKKKVPRHFFKIC